MIKNPKMIRDLIKEVLALPQTEATYWAIEWLQYGRRVKAYSFSIKVENINFTWQAKLMYGSAAYESHNEMVRIIL